MSDQGGKGFEPLYKTLANKLAADIVSGVYPVGSLLPTEAELCESFKVSRITCRGAIRELRNSGLVSSSPGVGTRVIAVNSQGRFLHGSETVKEILQFTDDLVFHLLEVSEEPIASRQQAEWLGVTMGERLVVVKGLRVPELPGSDPVCLSVHYLRGLDVEKVSKSANRIKGSITQLVETWRGKRVGVVRQSVEAARVSASDARLLKVARGEAALSTWRWYMTGDEEVLSVSNSTFPRGRYAWTMTVRRTE